MGLGGRQRRPIYKPHFRKKYLPCTICGQRFHGKDQADFGGRRETTAFCGSRPGRKHHAQITNRRCVAWQEAQDPSILGRRTPGGMGGVYRFHARRFERRLCGRYSLSKNLESSRGSKPFRASIVSGGSLKHFRVFRPLRPAGFDDLENRQNRLVYGGGGRFFHRKIPFQSKSRFLTVFACVAQRRERKLEMAVGGAKPCGFCGFAKGKRATAEGVCPRLGIIRARTAARIAGSSPRSERPRLLCDSRYEKICRRLGSGQYGSIFQTHIP